MSVRPAHNLRFYPKVGSSRLTIYSGIFERFYHLYSHDCGRSMKRRLILTQPFANVWASRFWGLLKCLCVWSRGNPSSRTLWSVWPTVWGTNSAVSVANVCPSKRWCSSSRESVTWNTTCALLRRRTWLSWSRWSIFRISSPKGKWGVILLFSYESI